MTSKYNDRLKAIQALEACIEITYEIECDTCKEGAAINSRNLIDAVAGLLSLGWATDAQGFALCKKCQRKAKSTQQ